MAKVFLSGIAVLDFVFSVDEMPCEAIKYRAKDAVVVGGGCASGSAVAVSKLGGQAYLAARLGGDVVGDLIVSELEKDGVDTSLINRAKDGKSSFSSIFVDASGERQIVNYRGTGLTDNDDWLKAPKDVGAVLADTRWAHGTKRAMHIAKKLGVPGIVDAEAPLDHADMSDASHVAFARRGLSEFTGKQDIEDGLLAAREMLLGWLCVTDGEHGTYVLQDEKIVHVPAFAVDTVDTLGAGDIWHGAFALRLAEGADEMDAIRFSNAAAAIKCTRFGGRAGCPDRAEVEAFLERAI